MVLDKYPLHNGQLHEDDFFFPFRGGGGGGRGRQSTAKCRMDMVILLLLFQAFGNTRAYLEVFRTSEIQGSLTTKTMLIHYAISNCLVNCD